MEKKHEKARSTGDYSSIMYNTFIKTFMLVRYPTLNHAGSAPSVVPGEGQSKEETWEKPSWTLSDGNGFTTGIMLRYWKHLGATRISEP